MLRKPTSISVCQYMGADCALELRNAPQMKLTDRLDLAELTRCLIFKNPGPFQELLQSGIEDVNTSDDCLLELKIRLIIASALHARAKRKQQVKEMDDWQVECEALRCLILAINCTRSLSRLTELKTPLTENQSAGCQNIRAYLQAFVTRNLSGHLEAAKLALHPTIELILTETEPFDSQIQLTCVYCDEPIPTGKLTCANEHEMPRCVFSMVQVPFMNQRNCEKCLVVAQDDRNSIREVIGEREDVLCPFCDSKMTGNES